MTANPDASINGAQALVRRLQAGIGVDGALDPAFPTGGLKESGIDPLSQDPY